jgi:hypothetical protein
MTEHPKYQATDAIPFNHNEIPEAISNPAIAKLYFNGFTLGITNSDVILLTKQNNNPTVVFNISLTTAKTLAKKLSELVINFETNAELEIMTTDNIELALTRMRENGK